MRWNRKPGGTILVAEPISRPVFPYHLNSSRLSRTSQPRRKSAKMPSPTRSSHRAASPSAPSSSRHHRSRHSHSHRHRPRESSRSRSPHRSDRHRSDRHHRHSEDKERGHHERRHRDAPAKPVVLPYQARELSGRDLKVYEPMFGMYLDIQKGKYIEDLSEDEVRGRWKSFTQKW